MAVAGVRLDVSLKDSASSGLQSLTNKYNRFSNTIQNSGNRLTQFNRQMSGASFKGLAANVDSAASSLSNMNKTMERLVYSASRYFVIYKAMGAVGDVWDVVVKDSYEYAKSLESNQIGIAGILKSMVKLNGENIKWNDAMAISQKSMRGLQSEALRTAATSQELIETFRAILGPGLASGMSIDQIVKLSTVGTNAVRSLGLPTNQYVQELRSIITEGIRPASSTLATSLGITNKDVKAAKQSAEGLFNFLMQRMEGFSDAVKYTSGTVEGRLARIKEGINVGVASASKELYKSFSGVLEQIADALIPVPKDLGAKWKINPAFVRGVREVSNTIGKLASGVGSVGSAISPFIGAGLGTGMTILDQLADKLKYIAGIYAVSKLTPFVRDMANLVVHSREAYEAETAFGRVLQGVSDRLSGRTVALEKAIRQQALYNEQVTKTSLIFAEQRKADSIARRPLAKGWSFNQATDMWKVDSFNSFVAKLREVGTEEERIKQLAEQYFSYLKKGTKEGAENIQKVVTEYERLYAEQQKNSNGFAENSRRAGEFLSTIGGLSMGIGFLCDLLAEADEENREWYESAGEATMTAGMFAMAIGSITSAVGSMIPAVLEGARALRDFAKAKGAAALGLGGGIIAGTAAIIAHKYNEFKKTGIASAVDEYGNVHSLNYNNIPGLDPEYRSEVAKNAVGYVEGASNVTTDNLGLKYPPGVGGSSGGGGGSSVNKAEQSAAKMLQFVQELNREITSLDGKAYAYDKTMASATAKLAAQEKEIVKAQQLGVDVGEVRNKQIEYSLAMERKAWENQQDEYLKWMKADETAAQNIYTMGGTMEQQREILGQRLEAHRLYLQEILAGDIENKDRRIQLQQELASVTKQIQENSVYEFKSGWKQALTELANQQINFKDTAMSLFGELENGLVTLVSGAGSAKDKLKNFVTDLTNSILKSLTQIIIKGLIAKAIMGIFGGGGSVDVTVPGGSGTHVVNFPRTPQRASGGSVSAGTTYLVGENGPELLHMGSSNGRVYSNRETNAMLGNGIKNIKVELINESGTQMQTKDSSITYDDFGTMVLTVWMEKVSNNDMGSRDLLKGMAMA